MKESTLIARLGQVDAKTAGEVFREHLRGTVREMLVSVMAEEVAELTGQKYQPLCDNELYRAGSANGQVLLEGNRENIRRPRVRRTKEHGTSEEVRLDTYAAAQDPGQLYASMTRALIAGVSSREMHEVHPDSPGTSKSSVSRLWKKVGVEFITKFRTRDIASQDWLVIMLDGLQLSSDQTAIAAIGITSDGKKVVLDFELGSTENYEVCRDLLARIVTRGFCTKQPLLAITDGRAQAELAALVARKGLTVRETEALVKRTLGGQGQSGRSGQRSVDPDIRRLQDDLSGRLGARVSIQHSSKGKGKLVVSYNSLDELEGILDHIQ
jgi:putative transposase